MKKEIEIKKNNELELLQEQIIKLEKQLESFKHSNDYFLKNKLFLHYDIKEPEKVIVDCETKLPVLTEVDIKKIQRGKESDPTHLIIEGDNYHALSVLNYTHAGKIDLIYIDPPYNTGNKDFIYNDRFVDREDSFRHSKWLSFMVNRLRLAKNLLADKGVIFISIDDNEQAYLRILCNQIFGEDNFINCIVLKTKASAGASGGGEDKGLKKNKEYLLMYSKSSNDLDIQKQYIEVKLTDYIKERRDKEIGFYYTRILFNDGKENLLGEKDEMKIYEHKNFTFLTINEVMKKDKLSEEDVYLKYFDKIFMVTNAQTSLPEKVIQFANGGKQKLLSYVYKPTSGKSKGNEIRKYIWNNTLVVWLKDSAIKKNNTIFKKVELGDLWSDISWGRLDLEGDVVFKNGKKPISLIKRLIDMKQNDAIVLDYFAGSGTTGHAVLDANKEDGGTRQFILCTYNENKIAEDVTYPRIKKVINGYGETAGIPANLRYFQTDFVAKGKNNDQTRTYLVASAVDMINVREATYEKIEVKKEYVLTQSATTFTAIIFDSFKLADIWKEIEKKNTGKLPVKLYIFSFSDDTSAFTDMIPKSTKLDWESKSIPEGILQVYQRLFKKKDK